MKIASRSLLPLELLMAVVIFSWGITGWIGRGPIHRTLEQQGLNQEWGLVLCGLGLAQFALCSIEWCFGRRWPTEHLLRCVIGRYWIAFLSGVVWVWVFYTMVTLRGAEALFSLSLQAPAGVFFSVWIFAGNLKVSCLLDPAVPTERLRTEVLAERRLLLED